ncbi:MAG TPA: hypothetical protein VF528_11860 [Pyrinomonadaceae bacterium]|jgi:hypothetical protein
MSEKMKQSMTAGADDGQSVLKVAIIVFAIIEALVLIPVVLRMILR